MFSISITMSYQLIQASRLLRCASYLPSCRPAIVSANQITNHHQPVCFYSGRKGFVQDMFDKLKEEFKKDKELKESIKKFREETEKLEKSDEIQKVRQYYKKIESEVKTDTSDKVRKALGSVKSSVESQLDELKKTEAFQKGFDEVGKVAGKVSSSVSSTAKQFGESDVLKRAKSGITDLEKELESDRGKMYRAPKILKTRYELAGKQQKIIEADEEATGVVMHKDSKWFAAWTDFKDNNQYMQKFFDLKTRYDESENVAVRVARGITERVGGLFGSVISNTELNEVLTEITKMDPNFSVESFLKFCQFEIIPNVLEAIIRGDLKILEDWCHEGPFNILATPIRQAIQLGCVQNSRVLDIHNLDISAGKMMDHGPVLVISFTAQQINSVVDKSGKIIEGDINKVLRVIHVWALCRDQSELNPWAAWRVLDIAMMPSDQWI